VIGLAEVNGGQVDLNNEAMALLHHHQARTELATIEDAIRGVGGIQATTSFDGPLL
jgi:hypothetical protein